MLAILSRWGGPIDRRVVAQEVYCTECGKNLPGPFSSDGAFVCVDHDVVCCQRCVDAVHPQCTIEKGLGPRLFRVSEFRFLLDYIQFSSIRRGEIAKWLFLGFQRVPKKLQDAEYLALELIVAYMAATEDLAILLQAIRRRLAVPESERRETLLETLLLEQEGKLPQALGNVSNEEELGKNIGLGFIRDLEIPDVDVDIVHDRLQYSIFRHAFGTQREQPNWRHGRWRTYQKSKHAGIIIKNARRVFSTGSFPEGPGVLDLNRKDGEHIPEVISYEVQHNRLTNWIGTIVEIGNIQQAIAFCYLLRYHRKKLIDVAPERDIGKLLSHGRFRNCGEFLRQVTAKGFPQQP